MADASGKGKGEEKGESVLLPTTIIQVVRSGALTRMENEPSIAVVRGFAYIWRFRISLTILNGDEVGKHPLFLSPCPTY